MNRHQDRRRAAAALMGISLDLVGVDGALVDAGYTMASATVPRPDRRGRWRMTEVWRNASRGDELVIRRRVFVATDG